MLDNERIAELLGAEMAGSVDHGHWKCAECGAEGDAEPEAGLGRQVPGALALHHHIQEARHWEDKDG